MSSDRHMPDLWLASYGQNLLHTSLLMEVPGAPQVLLSPQKKSSLDHSLQVEAQDLSDGLSLNTGQWRGVEDDLEVCRSVRGQNPAQALHCSNGYFGSAPCKENTVILIGLIIKSLLCVKTCVHIRWLYM